MPCDIKAFQQNNDKVNNYNRLTILTALVIHNLTARIKSAQWPDVSFKFNKNFHHQVTVHVTVFDLLVFNVYQQTNNENNPNFAIEN